MFKYFGSHISYLKIAFRLLQMEALTAHTTASSAERHSTRTKLWKAIWSSRTWRWKCTSVYKVVAVWCSRSWRTSWSTRVVTSALSTGVTCAARYSTLFRTLAATSMSTPSRSRRPRRSTTAVRSASRRSRTWKRCSITRRPPRTIMCVCTAARVFLLKDSCAVILRPTQRRRDSPARIAAKPSRRSSTWPIIS